MDIKLVSDADVAQPIDGLVLALLHLVGSTVPHGEGFPYSAKNLAFYLGAPRTRVDEALRRLEAAGYIERYTEIDNKGAPFAGGAYGRMRITRVTTNRFQLSVSKHKKPKHA